MRIAYIVTLLIVISIGLLSLTEPNEYYTISEADSVANLLEKLGDTPLSHKPDMSSKKSSIEVGKGLVLYGKGLKPNGRKTKQQSKHFVCTSCHNVVKEDPELTNTDPQKRLAYSIKNNIPFLQGTTLYGAVNRTNFYNDDYEKKYGSLVTPARNNIREAIQLCAVECSQGRALKDWEMESVLAFLWTLELKVEDLNLNSKDLTEIEKAINTNNAKTEAIELIKSKYLKGAPATFSDPPPNRREGYELTGNPDNGKAIYEISCLHCHAKKKYSFFALDNAKSTFKHLKKHIHKYDRYSIYQLARYGTSPMGWKEAYMPLYTQEKMSDQQVEDLRAYIEQQAK